MEGDNASRNAVCSFGGQASSNRQGSGAISGEIVASECQFQRWISAQ
jgi:hypothetical protein